MTLYFSFQIPKSFCSQSSISGYRKIPQEGRPFCCFICAFCPERHISNHTGIKMFNYPMITPLFFFPVKSKVKALIKESWTNLFTHLFLLLYYLFLLWYIIHNIKFTGTSLLAQCLKIPLSMQKIQVWSLVSENPAYHGEVNVCITTTEPVI